jgi:hypothetical protein
MAHYAHIKNGIVDNVIVADKEFIDSGSLGDSSEWIKTSYNTYHGEHTKGGIPLRKNFAGIGYKYDSVKDIFIPPKQLPSWIFNDDIGDYEPPTPMPTDDKQYYWNEPTLSWKINI